MLVQAYGVCRSSHTSRVVHPGFTIVELLIVVAILTIVLGLMVNLASSVRVQYATDVTKDLLRQLDGAVNQYRQRNGTLPAVTPLISASGPVTEEVLRKNAKQNNLDIVRALRSGNDLTGAMLDQLPVTLYSDGALRDAWNSPIVFMPRFDRLIGMALRDRPFFVSAGPDRKFLTLEDNFYSYEGMAGPIDDPKP